MVVRVFVPSCLYCMHARLRLELLSSMERDVGYLDLFGSAAATTATLPIHRFLDQASGSLLPSLFLIPNCPIKRAVIGEDRSVSYLIIIQRRVIIPCPLRRSRRKK